MSSNEQAPIYIRNRRYNPENLVTWLDKETGETKVTATSYLKELYFAHLPLALGRAKASYLAKKLVKRGVIPEYKTKRGKTGINFSIDDLRQKEDIDNAIEEIEEERLLKPNQRKSRPAYDSIDDLIPEKNGYEWAAVMNGGKAKKRLRVVSEGFHYHQRGKELSDLSEVSYEVYTIGDLRRTIDSELSRYNLSLDFRSFLWYLTTDNSSEKPVLGKCVVNRKIGTAGYSAERAKKFIAKVKKDVLKKFNRRER
jgi:hypothetical protein